MPGLFSNTFGKQLQSQPARPSSAAETVMNAEVFVAFRDFVYKQSGIYFTETKKYLLEGKIAKRLTTLGMSKFDEYLRYVQSPQGRAELPALYEAITINETYFFRSEPQFDAMISVLLPEIIAAKKDTPSPTVRIWSAASSSGEEAYTTAILINEKIKPQYPSVKFNIVGTDINNAVLETARSGIYRDYAIRNVPPLLMKKYFRREEDRYHLSEDIKKQVTFTNLNLFDLNAMRSMTSFDIIFCCNVLIYFDVASKQKVISALHSALNKNSFLFIGYSESLHGISKSFKLIHLPKAMVYKKE